MQTEQLKEQYQDVAEAYPDIFDTDKWVGFTKERGVTLYNRDGRIYNIPSSVLLVEASPGNGTRYRFHLITDAPGVEHILLALDPCHYAWKRTCHLRSLDVHPSYLMEKLGMNRADAVAFALVLRRCCEV